MCFIFLLSALDDEHIGDSKEVVDMVPVSCLTDPIDLLASTVIQDLPSGCPTWAARLRDCEVKSACS